MNKFRRKAVKKWHWSVSRYQTIIYHLCVSACVLLINNSRSITMQNELLLLNKLYCCMIVINDSYEVCHFNITQVKNTSPVWIVENELLMPLLIYARDAAQLLSKTEMQYFLCVIVRAWKQYFAAQYSQKWISEVNTLFSIQSTIALQTSRYYGSLLLRTILNSRPKLL